MPTSTPPPYPRQHPSSPLLLLLLPAWIQYNQWDYYVVNSKMTFDDAQRRCQRYRANLASIESEIEFRFLRKFVPRYAPPYATLRHTRS